MKRGILGWLTRRSGGQNRNQYKSVWNSVSGTEEEAKGAVSGHTDEELYRTTGGNGRDILLRTVGITKDDIVLEIGAGVGRLGATVAPICREWIGLDVSDNMVRHMARRLQHLKNVRTVVGNGYDLSNIPSESVTVVYCMVVFMHLQEWDRYNYIKEGFRILKPGGRMLVDNVNLLSETGWKFFEDHAKIPPQDRPPNISVTSTPQELRAYFQRAGFEKVEHHEEDEIVRAWGRKPQ